MRTAFRRRMRLLVCILLLATLLLGLLFWLFFDNYIEEKQTESLQSCAKTVGNLTQAYADDLQDWDFRTNLSVAATVSESDVLICAADGEVLVCAQDIQNCAHIGKRIDPKAIENHSVDVSQIYTDERIVYALPLQNEQGEVSHIILICVQNSDLNEFSNRIFRVFWMTLLIVAAAVLVTVPYLAKRETKPIQTMATAARQIAHGNFSVRVPTGNRAAEIEDLAVAFNNMALALQNAETVRQEFVANVSHELKTPMTTIAGYLDGMLDGTIPPEKYRHYMELVSSEARRLSRMVRNMLEVSRLRDQGIPPEELKNFDICDLTCQALLSFEQRILSKNLDVDVDMSEPNLTVRALPDSVTQVLYNLLDNAIKFADEGGKLTIRIKKQGNYALISVTNTGVTIAPEELPLIFDRFHKTDKSRSTDRDGVGLGLYIVKTIVMAHGGDIYVTSRDGKTEFTFTLQLPK